jgi:hypothetical protein
MRCIGIMLPTKFELNTGMSSSFWSKSPGMNLTWGTVSTLEYANDLRFGTRFISFSMEVPMPAAPLGRKSWK